MILQVVGWLVSRVHWGDFLVCFGGQEFLWQKIRKMFEVKIGRGAACGLRSISTCSKTAKKSQMSDWFLVLPPPKQQKKTIN